MVNKIKEILSSVRFYQLVAIAVLQLVAKEVPEVKDIVDAISLVLGGSVVIGSADSVAKKVGGK